MVWHANPVGPRDAAVQEPWQVEPQVQTAY